jgi:hypothetical protein
MIGNVNKPLKWLSTIDRIKIRKKEHGEESLFHRSGPKNNTTDQIMFVVSVPAEDKGSASTIVEKCTNYFFKVMAFRKYNSAGALALTYCEGLQGDGLFKYCLTKGGGNREKAEKTMTAELDAHFKGGPAYHYKVALDKFMVDWDIKEFLQNHLSCNSWEDLDKKSKKACFKYYPTIKFPEWTEISRESY